MSLLAELYTAVYSEVGSLYPSSAPSLTWYGPGVAPNDVTNPVLRWDLVTSLEWNALDIGSDYYSVFTIQFTGFSDDKSPLEAIQIVEAVKDIFRNNKNSLVLSTGRVLDIDIGMTRVNGTWPQKDGHMAMVDIDFEVGT